MRRLDTTYFNTIQDLLLDIPGDPLPTEITAGHPLELYADRATVRAIVQANLETLQHNAHVLADARAAGLEVPDVPSMEEIQHLIAQRRAMLGWLAKQPAARVFIALYPASEFEGGE